MKLLRAQEEWTYVSVLVCIPCQSCSQFTQIKKSENEHKQSEERRQKCVQEEGWVGEKG